MSLTMTNREKFLSALDERIRLTMPVFAHGEWVVLKEIFERLFPPYELDVREYHHENQRLDHAVGYDREEMDKHPAMQKFNKWLTTLYKTAYLEGKPMPPLSIIWEKLEELNIHPRLKMVAAFILYPVHQRTKEDFRKRDMIKELSEAHEKYGDEGFIQHLTKLRKEANENKTKSQQGPTVGGVQPGEERTSNGGGLAPEDIKGE